MIPADPYAGLGPATIIRGNALQLPLPDASVDLCLTSPPYFALRAYQDAGETYAGQIGSEATPDEFVSTLLEATREMVRVLKPSGSLWVNLGDSYAGKPAGVQGQTGQRVGRRSANEPHAAAAGRDHGVIRPKSLMGLPWRYALRCIDELGLILRAEVIWSKVNSLPESVQDRVRRSHEQWFHFVKSPRYFAAVDEIREPTTDYTGAKPATLSQRTSALKVPGNVPMSGTALEANPLGKLPGSVREVPSAPLKVPAHLGVDHFAAFPPAWPAWIIRGWSPSGVCVECGEGRQPVTTGENVSHAQRSDTSQEYAARGSGQGRSGFTRDVRWMGERRVTITGYACACPTPDAPTRPAVILDPFGGTGTTAMAARALGRHGITVDLSADYCRLARWRVQDMDELAAVRGIPRQGRKTDDAQVSLLDMLGGEVAS